jgi:hypothetical protein
MTESDPGTARRGFGKVPQRGSTVPTSVARTSAAPDRDAKRASDQPQGERRNAERNGSAAVPGTTRTSATKRTGSRKPRKARLRLTQIDAWSVMKTAFLLSIAMGIVTVVAVGIVWSVLGAAGVFDSLNSTVQTVMGNNFRAQDYVGTGRVLGFTMLVAVVDVVLLTAIATLGAFLYNLAATLLGGVELTLTEDG